MRIFAAGPLKEVHLREVDLINEEYRISPEHADERLARSIARFGVLESPVLLQTTEKFIIVFGHNRIGALTASGKDMFSAVVIQKIEPDAYMEYALLKNFRNGIGPIGKLRLVEIMLRIPGMDSELVYDIARTVLGIGDGLVNNRDARQSILGLSGILKSYLDSRDPGFKTIRNLTALPEEGTALLSRWMEQFPMRVNIFREIIDMMIDIRKRDGSLTRLASIGISPEDDRRLREEGLFREIFRARYPDYSRMKEDAEKVMKSIRDDRIDISVPPYFDGDSVSLTIRFNRKDDPGSVIRRLARIDPDDIKRLLNLL